MARQNKKTNKKTHIRPRNFRYGTEGPCYDVHFTKKGTKAEWKGHLARSQPDDELGKAKLTKYRALGHKSLSHPLSHSVPSTTLGDHGAGVPISHMRKLRLAASNSSPGLSESRIPQLPEKWRGAEGGKAALIPISPPPSPHPLPRTMGQRQTRANVMVKVAMVTGWKSRILG